MFNDLLIKLEKEGFEIFAYADALAIVGFDDDELGRLEKCIQIV